MNIKFSSIIALLVIILTAKVGLGQGKTFTAQEMHEDLTYLNRSLRRYHTKYYEYTSKDEMNAYYNQLKASIQATKTLGQFRVDVANAIDQVRCGHMNIELGKNSRSVDSLLLMPFDLYVMDKKMFVRNYLRKDSLFAKGDEILSINGVTTDKLIQKLSAHKTSDALNFTHKENALDKLFYVYHYIEFGKIDTFRIEKFNQNDVPTIYTIPAQYRNTKSLSYYEPHPIDSSKIIIGHNSLNLQSTDIDPDTYMIDYNTFSGSGQKKAHRKIFKYLKKHKAKNLIIDLRGNGGGKVMSGYNFMKYLVKTHVFAANISRKPNLTFIDPRIKGGFWEKITPILFMTNPLQYPSKQGWHHVFPFMRKYKYHFDGQVYIMTDGGTFSMSAIVASKLKNEINAITVGTETGGSSYASRGMASGYIVLPNSKIKISLNLYQLKYGKGSDDKRGVIPTVPIEYAISDKLDGKDVEMIIIKELIHNKTKR